MNEFNPGDGWREVPEPADTGDGDEVRWRSSDDSAVRYWVREVPVPPLPTEPYTVIRATLNDGKHPVLMLNEDGVWDASYDGYGNGIPPERITGFEVLAEPRAVDLAEFTSDPFGTVRRQTAKAVLDRVLIASTYRDSFLDKFNDIARDFGVEA